MTKMSPERKFRKVFSAKPGEEEVVVPITEGPGAEEMVVSARGAFKRPKEAKPGDLFMPDVWKFTRRTDTTELFNPKIVVDITNKDGSLKSTIPWDPKYESLFREFAQTGPDVCYVIGTALPHKFALEKGFLPDTPW